jgi:hypothetical protein
MMNNKEFQLITLKTAISRYHNYGKIIDGNGTEMSIDQLKSKLFVNVPLPADDNDDINVKVNTVKNIGNLNIIKNKSVDCNNDSGRRSTFKSNVETVTEEVTTTVTDNEIIDQTTDKSTVPDYEPDNQESDIQESDIQESEQPPAGKLFQEYKETNDGPIEPTVN